nr:YppE family protein [Mammaliicoccus sp. Marseille-Q6498]
MLQELIDKLTEMQQIFKNAKDDHEYDFYKDVVPFVEEVDHLLEAFTVHQASILKLQYMNQQKYELLIDNYKELSVECHYKRTSKKIFLEKHKAVQHDLNYILRHLGDLS